MRKAARIPLHLLCVFAAVTYVVRAIGPHDSLADLGPVASVLGLTAALALISCAVVHALAVAGDRVARPWVAPEPAAMVARLRSRKARPRCARRSGKLVAWMARAH